MTTKKKPSYVPAPAVPAEMAQRVQTILEVLAGRLTMAQAARTLGMSRNHFQTILHRGMGALVSAVTPAEGGRPSKPQNVALLEQENATLRRENARLRETAQTSERFLQAASGLLQGRLRPARQSRRRKGPSASDDEGNEGEPRRTRRLRAIEHMRTLGLAAADAAAMCGVHASTVRRWKRRTVEPVPRPSPRRLAPAGAVKHATQLVCRLKGQVGAEALRRSVPELSRRQAARIKVETLTLMERARKHGLVRVRVTSPGVVRGMDGMHVRCVGGPVHALVSADAAVPYRTSVTAGAHYDAKLVARALGRDIEMHGAPLVYRLDRARAHDAPQVRELLEQHQVLVLHGPPHCARFYGQLERQNREHRAWSEELERNDASAVEPILRIAIEDLNTLWRRRALGWQTAAEAWDHRPEVNVDRAALIDEVEERAAAIRRHLQHRGEPADLAQRLAIEQALAIRGYLSQTIGGWC